MERLTKRLPNGVIHVDFAKKKESVMGRLASIEDILGDEYDLDELREMVQAKRDGRCWYIEVKKPGEKPRENQSRFLQAMRDSGALAGVAHSAEEAVGIVFGGEQNEMDKR